MKLKNCLGVACFILVLFVSLFLNGGVGPENSDLKMTTNESNISMALNGNQISTIFNGNMNNTQKLSTSHFAREVRYHNLTDYLVFENSHFTIDGQEISDDMTVNYGSKIDIHLEWALPNTERWTTEDVFVYDLPEGFTFANGQTGSVMDNAGNRVGVYTISNNEVTIQYIDEDFVSQSNIIGAMNVSGEITDVSMGGSDGGKIDLNIPGVGQIIINVNPTSALRINKDVTLVSGETDIYEFTVSLNSPSENTNVVITDTMGKYLELMKETLSISKNNSEMTSGFEVTVNEPSGFVYTIDKLNKGDKVVITYRAKVLDGGFISGNEDDNTKNAGLTNYVKADSDELPNEITAHVTVDTYKASLTKSGQYNLSDNTVTWTITVKPGQKGVTLKDVITEGQEVVGDITIDPADRTIDAGDLANGIFFDPDSTGEKVYTIKYKAKATQSDAETLKNKATIFVGSEDVFDEEEVIINLIPGVTIDKTVSDHNDREGIIYWNNKITIPNLDNTNKSFEFADVLGEGLTLDESSIKITPETDYSLDVDGNTFTIKFNDLVSPGKEFNISYRTTFDNTIDKQTFVNKATINYGGQSDSDEAKYEYTKKTDYINKSVSGDDFTKTGVAKWNINIDRFPNEEINNAHITDVIPEGMEYVDGSAKIVINNVTTDITPIKNENTLVFNLNEYLDELDNMGATIYYETKIKEIFSESKIYTNNAKLTIDGEAMGEASASIEGAVSNLISKDYEYTTSTAPIANYTIKVNEGAIDISPDSKTLMVEDKMGDALSFVRGSLKIDGEDADPKKYSWDSTEKLLTIFIPDNESVTITYQVLVTLRPGDELNETNAFNTVNLNGFVYDSTETGVTITGKVLESVASSSSDSATVRVYKHREGAENIGLSGVKFDLYEVGFTLVDGEVNFTREETLVKSLTTDEDGYVIFGGINYDRIYKLVESETVDGYVLNSTPYYFVFPGNDNIDFPEFYEEYRINSYPDEAIVDITVSNEYSKLDINVTKVWNDDNYENRPDSITVYLKRNGEYVYSNGEKVSMILSSNNNWKATFEGLDKYDENHNRYDYTLEEDVPNHYQADYNASSNIDTKDFVITNTLDDSSLTIQKVVGGNAGETDRYFTFKVVLKDKNGNPLDGEFYYTGSKEGFIKSGDTVKLKHGETITINGLPYGTLYEVTELEANSDRYETIATNDKGKITFDENKVVFTNIKNEGKLTIDKTVGGNSGETDRYFNFKVILYDENGEVLEGEYKYIGSKTGMIKSGDIIKLKHGEFITITCLPVGASYKVIELEADSDGYKTTVTNSDGVIGLEGNISSFMNYKDVFEKPYQKANIPQTGGSDNMSLYGILTIASGMLSVYLLRRKNV